MALIAWEERESLVTDITLVKLLGILNVDTFDVFFPLVVGLKKLLAKRAWQSWSLVKFHVIGQLVFGFEFFPASYANELWWLLVCMNHKMFFQFPRLSESSATLRTQIFLLSILLLCLLSCLFGFAGVIDVSLFRVVSLPRDDFLMNKQHMISVCEVIMERFDAAVHITLIIIFVF